VKSAKSISTGVGVSCSEPEGKGFKIHGSGNSLISQGTVKRGEDNSRRDP